MRLRLLLASFVAALIGLAALATSGREARAAATDCSVANASAAATAAGFHTADSPDGKTHIIGLICGPFFGPGSAGMAGMVPVNAGCGVSIGWLVFRLTGDRWQVVLKHENGARSLQAVGSDIKETQGFPRPGDPICSPSRMRTRIWHWNGSGFVATAWKVTPGTAGNGAGGGSRNIYFKTPSGNIVCGYLDPTPEPFVSCRIKSGLRPPPPTRGPRCLTTNAVFLHQTGRTTTGFSPCPGEEEGDAGVLVYESQARVLGYGKTLVGGGIRCQSQFTGLTCRNRSGHGFFLSRERWRSF